MGSNISSTSLTPDQKAAVLASIATTLDASDPDAPPQAVVNDLKFAAARAASIKIDAAADDDLGPPITRSLRAVSVDSQDRELKAADASSQIDRSGSFSKGASDTANARLLRTLSLNYEEEVSQISSSPSPMSRANFRRRRLTYAKRGKKVALGDDVKEKSVFSAGEIGESPSTTPPFPPSIVGTYSCHGIEPAYDSVDRSDVVIAKINQDRGCVAYPFGMDRRQALFAAYDGHGEQGEVVSAFAMHEVQHRLEAHPDFILDVEKAFKEVFVEVDEALKTQQGVDAMYSGTTAVAVLIRGQKLYIANCGDSRAVIGKRNVNGEIVALNLSEDQNPNHPVEQARIEAAGGFVSPPPEPGLSARVWLDADFTQIGLAMARSIGDHAVSPVGVIAEPVVTTYELSDSDQFMVAASDGVWEFIDSDEAVSIVTRYLPSGADKACEVLIETAAQRWREYEGDYRDDITAVVVKVQELWKGVEEEELAGSMEAEARKTWDDIDNLGED